MRLFKFFKKEKNKPEVIKLKLELTSILNENISKDDKVFFEKVVENITNNDALKEYFSVECDVDFVNKETLLDKLNSITEFTKSNYNLEPFACDGAGGIYVILNNKKIGYIDSEGGAGIVANNLKDFFSIVTNCGYLSDYAKFGCLIDEKSFMNYFAEFESSREKNVIKKFIEDNSLDDDPKKIYKICKNAILTEPQLLLKATSEDYVDYEQLFKF
jgi:hypothetical protein